MSLKRKIILHDEDHLVFASGTEESIKQAFRQQFDYALRKIASNDPAFTDPDTGEIIARSYRLIFGEDIPDRSIQQNKFYWGAVLRQISEQADGHWTPEAWHEAFKRTELGYEQVRVQVAGRKGPTVYRRLRSTTELSVREFSEYIERVMATAATDLGVQFDLDPRERDAALRKPKRKAKQQEPA